MLLKLIVLCVLSQVIKAQNDVTFRLFTRQNADNYVQLVTGQLQGQSIDVNKPFKFIIHGYTDSGDRDWIRSMKNSYLKKGDYNVVVANWEDLAAQIYDDSAADTRVVGKYVADLIIDLNKTFGLSFKNVHLIGHSLGSHVSAFAGKNIIASGYEKIARITGMDPAGPLFYGNPPEERLSVGDADFIDCIHTDGFKFGYGTSLGDVDFYPNGGTALQPGCLTFSPKQDLGPIVACSHCRSYAYFDESINSVGFVAKKCSNYWNYMMGQCNSNPSAIMGENIDLNTRGNYYLNTNAWSPYAKRSNQLNIKLFDANFNVFFKK